MDRRPKYQVQTMGSNGSALLIRQDNIELNCQRDLAGGSTLVFDTELVSIG